MAVNNNTAIFIEYKACAILPSSSPQTMKGGITGSLGVLVQHLVVMGNNNECECGYAASHCLAKKRVLDPTLDIKVATLVAQVSCWDYLGLQLFCTT